MAWLTEKTPLFVQALISLEFNNGDRLSIYVKSVKYRYVDVTTEIQNFQNYELFFLSKPHIRLQYLTFFEAEFLSDTLDLSAFKLELNLTVPALN